MIRKVKFGILLISICSAFLKFIIMIMHVYLVRRIHEHKTNTQSYGLLQQIKLASPEHLDAKKIAFSCANVKIISVIGMKIVPM